MPINNDNDNDNDNNNKSKLQYYHKKISQNPLRQFFKKLYNFDNFIRNILSDQNKITFAMKYLPMSH